jgi:hypothetical protein
MFDVVGAQTQVALFLDTSRRFQVGRGVASGDTLLGAGPGGPTTSLATSATVQPLNTWIHIEVKFKVDNATGSYEVWINGVQDAALTASGVDTQVTANATASHAILNCTASYVWYCDDFNVKDDTGSVANGFNGVTGCALCQMPTPAPRTGPRTVARSTSTALTSSLRDPTNSRLISRRRQPAPPTFGITPRCQRPPPP